MTEKTDLLKEALLKYFERMQEPSGSWTNFYDAFPDADLAPRDYLEFAENELNQLSAGEEHLINCVGHLKRAIDCQLDSFFHIIGLHNIIHKRNLKFDKKLEFLREIDVVSPRTLSRLNHIRNKLEHEYKLPSEIDLELYFDLSTAFVSSIELTIVLLTRDVLEYEISKDETGKDFQTGYHFNLKHNFPSPEITIDWTIDDDSKTITTKLSSSSNEVEISDFAYFLKVYILLLKFEGHGTNEFYIFTHI